MNYSMPRVDEGLSPVEKKLHLNKERKSCTVLLHKLNLSLVTFYSTTNKLLIVVSLSRMCCLCLTLPPPHGRWYNACYESGSHFQDGQNRTSFPELVKKESRNTAGYCPNDCGTMTPLV